MREARRAMARLPSLRMGRVPDAPALSVRDPWPGDPARGAQLIKGELDAVNYTATDQAGAEAAVNDQLKQLSGKALKQPVLDRAFSKIKLTVDPLATDFPQLTKDQVTAKIAKTAPGLTGFADLKILNSVLTAAGKPAVDAGSLGGN